MHIVIMMMTIKSQCSFQMTHDTALREKVVKLKYPNKTEYNAEIQVATTLPKEHMFLHNCRKRVETFQETYNSSSAYR